MLLDVLILGSDKTCSFSCRTLYTARPSCAELNATHTTHTHTNKPIETRYTDPYIRIMLTVYVDGRLDLYKDYVPRIRISVIYLFIYLYMVRNVDCKKHDSAVHSQSCVPDWLIQMKKKQIGLQRRNEFSTRMMRCKSLGSRPL